MKLERKIHTIKVENMTAEKGEQYIKKLMNKYRQSSLKPVINSDIKDDDSCCVEKKILSLNSPSRNISIV